MINWKTKYIQGVINLIAGVNYWVSMQNQLYMKEEKGRSIQPNMDSIYMKIGYGMKSNYQPLINFECEENRITNFSIRGAGEGQPATEMLLCCS